MTSKPVRNLLFFAYYFPPLGMGGVQRALKFARYLPQFNWRPFVITVKDILYYAKDITLLQELKGLPICRTESLDPARLAFLLREIKIFGRRPSPSSRPGKTQTWINRFPLITRNLFYPDSKSLWLPFARRAAQTIRKRVAIDAVFSTSPPISSHLLAARINLPWIADFRDYWTIGDGIYTPTRWHQRRYEKIMKRITRSAKRIVTVSQPIADSIAEVADPEDRKKIVIIPNGFDPNDFISLTPADLKPFTFVYSGNLNPQRSPKNFFMALREVFKERPDWRGRVNVLFAGKHFDLTLPSPPLEVQPYVRFVDYLPHEQSLSLISGAGALLLLLSSSSAPGVVTGKIFEYLATRRPILALIPARGAAFELLRQFPDCYFADPEDIVAIKSAVIRLLEEHFKPTTTPVSVYPVAKKLLPYTRREQTRRLAGLLEDAISSPIREDNES